MRRTEIDRFEWGVIALNLLVRAWFSVQTLFTEDELAIYRSAVRFFKTGKPSLTGARIVYSDTVLPGMLQDLVAGLPLFVTGGRPWFAAVIAGVVNGGAAILLWRVYCDLFPQWNRRALLAFILFAPWTCFYAGYLNPAWVFPIAVLVFWAIHRIARGGDRLSWFTLGVALPVGLQFNLSVLYLVAWAGLALVLQGTRVLSRRGFSFLALGTGLGSAPLIPYFLSNSSRGNSFIWANVHFDWAHFQDLYKVFFRFLTFPTGETTRFLGSVRGFGGAVEVMVREPLFLGLGIWALTLAVAAVFVGIKYQLTPKNYRMGRTPEERHRLAITLAPILMMALFLLSLKEPSAHSLLPILPMSFFPLLWQLRRRPLRASAMGFAAGVSFVFGLASYVHSYRPSIWTTEIAVNCVLSAQAACSAQGQAALLEARPEGVREVLDAIRSYQSTRR